MKLLRPIHKWLCLSCALFLLVTAATAQDAGKIQFLMMGWDDLSASEQALASLPPDTQEPAVANNSCMQVILTKASVIPDLPASTRYEMRKLALEGVPIICQGGEKELSQALEIGVFDGTDEASRGDELMALINKNGVWSRAYFLPSAAQDSGPANLLGKALAWVSNTCQAPPTAPTASARIRTGPVRENASPGSTGNAWNSLISATWNWDVLDAYGTWVSEGHCTLWADKLKDNVTTADWYCVQVEFGHDAGNLTDHTYILEQLFGMWPNTNQMPYTTFVEVGPDTTESSSSVSYSIGGELGLSAEGPNFGLNSSVSSTYNIPDAKMLNQCQLATDTCAWEEDINGATSYGWPSCSPNQPPADIAKLGHTVNVAAIWKTTGPGLTQGFQLNVHPQILLVYSDVSFGLFGCNYYGWDQMNDIVRTIQIYTNFPPDKPQAPSTRSPQTAGVSYECQASSLVAGNAFIDPDGDPVSFQFDWGDGYSEWGPPTQSYFYTKADTYNIRAKARDSYGNESLWSDPYQVTVHDNAILTITKLRAKLNFAKTNADNCNLKASLSTPADFTAANKTLRLNIGDMPVSFTLNAKGQGKSAAGSCKLSRQKAGKWTLMATLKNGSWAKAWGSYGMIMASTPKAGVKVTMPVSLAIGDVNFVAQKTLIYKATGGKSGMLK